jgi:hypothetical protein
MGSSTFPLLTHLISQTTRCRPWLFTLTIIRTSFKKETGI